MDAVLRQYRNLKVNYPDSLLLMRIADIYEVFGDDAVKVSWVLGLTLTRYQDDVTIRLTSANIGQNLHKLQDAGYVVVLAEQTKSIGRR